MIKKDGRAIDPSFFNYLAGLNQQRGNKAFGYFDGKTVTKLNDSWYDNFVAPQTELLLAHLLSPTGKPLGLDGVHPFERSGWLLAHNGILLNRNDFPEWRGAVDSQTILNGFVQESYNYPEVDALTNVLEKMNGQHACWLTNGKTIYLWSVMSPVYYYEDDSLLTFSSAAFKVEGQNAQKLEQGIVFEISNGLQVVKKFNYKTHYKRI